MGRRGSVLTLVIINIIVTLVVVFVAVSFINSQNASQPSQRVVITVPVLITATKDPNLTETIKIITATPLPGTPGVVSLPTGLIDDLNGTVAAVPTIDPALFESSSALQQTATALPPNCILHTVAEGDTPFGIAEQYGADGDQLMAVNGLDDQSASLMQIGDVLIVPLPGCSLIDAIPTQSSATEEVTAAPTTGTTSANATAAATVESSSTAVPPTLRPTATLPPTATNAQVEIVRVISPGDINAEGVDVRNNGAVVDLTGWKLANASGVAYTFPQQRLFTGSVLTVYTRVGTDTPTAKFWGRDSALWSSGATLTLTDANGKVQSTYIVPVEDVMAAIDEQIQDAIRKGQFNDLPGAGKPLKLEDDSNTPEHLRMAHKLLRDNDLVPDWMAQGKQLDAERERLITGLSRAAREHRGSLNDAARSAAPEQQRQNAEQRWQTAVESLRASAKKLNSQILSYNLKVPQGVAHKRHFDFEAELQKQR